MTLTFHPLAGDREYKTNEQAGRRKYSVAGNKNKKQNE